MKILMYILPLAYVLGSLFFRIRKSYKEGLFCALLQLGNTIVSAVLAFVLARLLLNPAKIDLFGLGQMLRDKIPDGFFVAAPELEALILALPTALAALLGFSLFFSFLRWLIGKVLDMLSKKYGWQEKFPDLKGRKWLALIPCGASAIIALLVDMVLLGGFIHIGANLMVPAQYVFDGEAMSTISELATGLSESPAVTISDALGCRWAFNTLTTAQRDGEPFSVGEELIQWSGSFDGLGQVVGLYGEDGAPPDAETLRSLPEALLKDPHTPRLAVGLVQSNLQDLTSSDAVKIISQVLGTTPARFGEYMAQLTPEQLEQDLYTICNIAALMAERDIIPASGELIDMAALEDPALLQAIREEVLKNPDFAAFFAIT